VLEQRDYVADTELGQTIELVGCPIAGSRAAHHSKEAAADALNFVDGGSHR
jgi:hypothetical protein